MRNRVEKLCIFCKKLEQRKLQLEKKRLFTGLSFFGLLILASLQKSTFLGGASLLFLALFLFYLFAHKRVLWRLEFAKSVFTFYQRQQQRVQGTYSNPEPFQPHLVSDVQRRLSTDLDLFGNQSMFELIDEAFTQEGKNYLAMKFFESSTSLDSLKSLQAQIRELKPLTWRLLRLTCIAKTNERTLQFQNLKNALENPINPQQEKRILTYNLIAFGFASSVSGLSYFDALPLPPALPMAIFALISWSYLGQVSAKFKSATSISEEVKKIEVLFQEIENHFKTAQLKALFEKTLIEKPSRRMKQLNRILSFMSVQGHPLIHLGLNAILPWDQIMNWLYERWRRNFAKNFRVFLEELKNFEYISSGVYLTYFHDVEFPEILDAQQTVMAGKQIRHPLIEKNHVIANDFSMGQDNHLGLITGSNMAGKSTFLRTLGLNHLVAGLGFPVFAKEFTTSHVPLFTSLRITDSLESGFSSFYTEAKVISEIVRLAEQGGRFFYFIDEIFRGTNNRERFIGSQAVIKSLVETQSAGLISSHDLELAKMVDAIPRARNWHFSEQIKDSKMSFSYKVIPGPCKSTNALIILKQLGLKV